MSAGAVWTYMHSDSVTRHKGCATVKVLCETDFAARTPAFEDFAADAAKLSYGAQATRWDDVVAAFPEAEHRLAALARDLREKITVAEIVIVKL